MERRVSCIADNRPDSNLIPLTSSSSSIIQVVAVKVSEVGCLGYRENKCSLQYYWDKQAGSGPWEPFDKDIA